MNIPLWIPWKPEEFSSSPVPRRTPYSVTTSVRDWYCQLQNTQHLRMGATAASAGQDGRQRKPLPMQPYFRVFCTTEMKLQEGDVTEMTPQQTTDAFLERVVWNRSRECKELKCWRNVFLKKHFVKPKPFGVGFSKKAFPEPLTFRVGFSKNAFPETQTFRGRFF
jgi:hypothetical protein